MTELLNLVVEGPVELAGPQLALRRIAGLPSLASQLRESRYDLNAVSAVQLVQQFQDVLREPLARWVLESGLPRVEPLRVRHNRILMCCLRLADLLGRLPVALQRSRPAEVHLWGGEDWERATVEAVCDAASVRFSWTSRSKVREALLPRARLAKQLALDLRDAALTRATVQGEADFVVFMTAPRLCASLYPVFAQLKGTVELVEDRSYPVSKGPWSIRRFGGERPRDVFHATSLEASLQATIRRSFEEHPVSTSGVKMEKVGAALITSTLTGVVSQILAVERLLAASPDALVVATPVGEPFLEIARALGRTVAVVQTCGITEYTDFLPGRGQYLVNALMDKTYLERLGVPSASIQVCGAIPYVHLASMDVAAERKAWRAQFQVAEQRPLILVASTNPIEGRVEEELREDLLRDIYSAAASIPDAAVVVKLHPYEFDLELHRRLAREAGLSDSRFFLRREPTIASLIAACDVMAMMVSTVGAEAILLDRPVVDVPFTRSDPFGYQRTGAVLTANGQREVAAALKSALFEPVARDALAKGRERYRAEYLSPANTAVTDTVAQALMHQRKQSGAATQAA